MYSRPEVMKQPFYIGLVIFLVTAGAWSGRVAWRAYKDLVTLHVRNMPLAEVTRRIERQTWEKIVPDTRLDAQITLNVKNMPLQDVLDRIAEQAGGLATAVHAVYKSSGAMDRLFAAARNGDVAKASGWTNLAPRLEALTPMEGGPKRRLNKAPRDVLDGSTPIMRFRGMGGDGEVQEEIITPERLLLETKLQSSLRKDSNLGPDRESALATAREVQGKYKPFYALRKSATAGLMVGPLRHFRSEAPRFHTEKGDPSSPTYPAPADAPP